MAIKVKHEMNAAPAAASTLAAGRARRSMETARMFASGSGSGGRGGGTTGAHASAISPGGAQAHVVGAHAPGVTDWEGTRSENAAQEAARLKQALDVAEANNAAAKERAQMGIDADAEKLKNTQAFTKKLTKFQQELRNDAAEAAGAREMEMLRARAGIAEEAADANFLRRQEELDAQMERDRELYDYKLTQKQRMEIAAINDAVENARKSGRYTPQEMAALERQADMQRMGIKPQAVPRGISPQRTVDENMVNIDGRRYFYTPNGDLKELDPRPSFKDFVSAFQSMRTVNTTRPGPGGVGTESVKETLSPEDTAAVVRSAADMYQRMFGVAPQTGPATQSPPATAPATQPTPQPTAQPAPTPAAPTSPAPTPAAQPVVRADSHGVNWEIVFDANGKPIGKRRVRQ